MFDKFGYYYERKKGEFSNGVNEKYINRKQIINRDVLLRVAICCDLQPSLTRTSINNLYSDDYFNRFLSDASRAVEFFYGYMVYQRLQEIKRELSSQDVNDRYGVSNYGNSLRYGEFSVVAVCVNTNFKDISSLEKTDEHIDKVLADWPNFEKKIIEYPSNKSYFRIFNDPDTDIKRSELNFEGYYKGRTLNSDLKKYFNF